MRACVLACADDDPHSGGAYPLKTFDIVALAALVWLVSSVLRAARARLDRPAAAASDRKAK